MNILKKFAAGTFAVAALFGYYPFVSPNTYYTIPGSIVNFSGIRFKPGEDVEIRSGGVLLGNITANNSGSFATIAFPTGYSFGDIKYVFSGKESAASAETVVRVGKLDPWITLNTYYAPARSTIEISGRQFGSQELVTFAFEGIALGTKRTDAAGNVSFSFVVPSGSEGLKTVTATGALTGWSDSEIFSQGR